VLRHSKEELNWVKTKSQFIQYKLYKEAKQSNKTKKNVDLLELKNKFYKKIKRV
jgi:hypothetical protein